MVDEPPFDGNNTVYPRWEMILELANSIDGLFQEKSKSLRQINQREISLDEVELIIREIQKISNEYLTRHYVKQELQKQGLLDIPSKQMSEKPRSNYIA